MENQDLINEDIVHEGCGENVKELTLKKRPAVDFACIHLKKRIRAHKHTAF